MKHINTIIRTLCLTALLCMTSVSTSAYVVYDKSGNLNTDLEDNVVVVNGGNANEVNINLHKVVIILPGARFSITSSNFHNNGTLYVFGELFIAPNVDIRTPGSIYVIEGGSVTGKKIDHEQLDLSDAVNATRKVEGKAATDTEDGWKDYWEGEIKCGDDVCPIGIFFEDEAHTKPIDNLEAWKQGAGKIYSLPLYRSEALSAINIAIKDLAVIQTYKDLVDECILAIENAKTVDEIDNSKSIALNAIAKWKMTVNATNAINEINQARGDLVFFPKYKTDFEDCVSAIEHAETVDAISEAKTVALGIIEKQKTFNGMLSECFGTLFTSQEGNTVEITSQNGETMKLYNPKKVNFKKSE